MHWPRTLLWRLGLGLLVLQILVALGAGWLIARHVVASEQHEVRAELGRHMVWLLDRYGPMLATEDFDGLMQLTRTDAERNGLRTTVVRNGIVLADSHVEPEALENEWLRPEVDAVRDRRLAYDTRDSGVLGGPSVYMAMRLEAEAGSPFVLRVGRRLPSPRIVVVPVLRMIAAAALVSTLLTLLVFWTISRRMARAEEEIIEGAARLADGDTDFRMKTEHTQLSGVADGLNDLAEQLGEREQKISLHEKELEAILQSITSGVIALDGDQRIVDLNRAAETLLGIGAPETRGRMLQEVVRQPELHGFVNEAMMGSAPPTVEFTLSGEQPITVEATGDRLTGDDGEPQGLLVLLNDVTRLRRLESLRSDFAANVSHELRTPITNIKGYVETLLDVGAEGNGQGERFLTIIKQNSDRLAAIVEDVMALTKLEQPEARDTLAREATPLLSVIRTVIAQFDRVASAKGIALTSDAPGDLVADLHGPLIEQALSNLVSNAINYSPNDTLVTISGRRRDDGAIDLAVTDQGPGISAQHLPRLFERFYRVDKGRSREVGGTGLGLAIVKHIALVHGGNVEVDSTVGRGSAFRIILPTG